MTVATSASAAHRASLLTSSLEEERGARSRDERDRRTALIWTLIVLGFGAVMTITPLWIPLVLAAWAAIIVRPLHARLSGFVHGRSRAAGVFTVALVLVALAPLVVTVLSLAASITSLIAQLQANGNGDALRSFLSSNSVPLGVEQQDARRVLTFLQRHGSSALGAVRTLFGAVTTVAVGLFVFVFSFYTFLVDGRRAYQWLLQHSPINPAHVARLTGAFEETGRGILISFGLTSLVQGGLSTIGYLVIGVPQALMLGLLTSFGSFIPIVGTGLVWVPVTVGLVLSHQTGAAIATAALGLAVSFLDNFIRPALSRYGQLQLPTFLIFTAMLGGVAMFGAGGLILGPLLLRMAIEALRIWREVQGRAYFDG